jgi:ribose transport system permease protein
MQGPVSIARARSAIAAQGFLRGGRLEWRMLALLVVLIAGLSFVSPYFLTFSNISNVLDQSVVTGIVAIGQTFVILTAGIDLSVGSLVGFTGIVLGLSFARFGIPGAIVAALLAGAAAGFINGAIITKGRVAAFVVTLGMMSIARSQAYVLSGANSISSIPPPS